MLSILRVRLKIKVKVGIPESFKVGWYPPKKTGSSHLKFDCFYHKYRNGGFAFSPGEIYILINQLSPSNNVCTYLR